MAITFPSSPSLNDTFTVNGRTYVWNGTTWRTIKAPVPDILPTLSVDNDFSAGGTFHVDSTNNEIGIGTAAPSHQLHLTQDLGVDGNLIVGGTITVPTPIAGTNDTTAATTAFVQTAVAGIVDSAPTTLDTLNELAAALNDDANFSTTITNSIATKQDASTALTTSTTFGGDVSGTYNNIVIADDSHNHTIANIDNLQTTLDGKLSTSGTATDSDRVDGQHAREMSWGHDLNHGTWTNFNSFINTDNFGAHFIQGTTNGPGHSGATQYYHQRMSLGANYNNYSLQFAIPRNVSNAYLYYRNEEGGGVSAWYKIRSGYADSAGNADTVDGLHYSSFLRSDTNTATSGYLYANNWIGSFGGTSQIITYGTNNNGAIYIGGSNGNAASGGIEASWNNELRPTISIGVTRDSNNTKAMFTYHGWGALYANGTERFYWDTGGFRLSGTQYSSSTIRLKENIREANLDSLGVIADADESFDKWASMHTVVFDWKEKPTDPIWVGCNEHSNRIECEASGCLNSKTELVEHECGNGWCYGTAEDPCPRYRGVRDVVGWIAEEVRGIYGDKMVGYSENRVIESINMTALYAEHVNVTQHLIKYVRELEQRIAELETV